MSKCKTSTTTQSSILAVKFITGKPQEISCSYLSRLVTKPTYWHVRPAKTQISLGIRPVRPESSLSAGRKLGSLATHQHAQADLSPRWAHCHFVDFVTRRLIWYTDSSNHVHCTPILNRPEARYCLPLPPPQVDFVDHDFLEAHVLRVFAIC